jgi:hypothetical protein
MARQVHAKELTVRPLQQPMPLDVLFHQASTKHALLEPWRWLIGGAPTLVGWSAGGDMFIEQADGKIAMIDLGAANVSVVADGKAEFRAQLATPRGAAELLQLAVVEAFVSTHGALHRDCCLGYTTLPALGGSYTVDNRYSVRIEEHAAFTGDVHRQIRDLPDGAKVTIKIVP